MADGTVHIASADDPVPESFLGIERSVTGRRWVRRAVDERLSAGLAQRLGIDPLLADVILARGAGPDTAARWLAPRLRDEMPDPSCLKEMDVAAERIAGAIVTGETIGLFGDYDVDGTTSAALMARYCRAVGAAVAVHLPDRMAEGYGPNLPAFEGLRAKGASLILTLDCGAGAPGVLSEAARAGFDVIVLDHHAMETRPEARAVINPNRPDCLSGLGMLSAAGVCFMTLAAVNRTLRGQGFFADRAEPNLLQWLDLVALSLVCDVMPLRGLSRVLTRQGLAGLPMFGDAAAEGGNPGIRALALTAGLKGAAKAHHFGFAIGPRINAAGRIGHAGRAFDLLTTDDPARALALAEELSDLNGVRQGVEQAVLDEALRLAGADMADAADAPGPIIVAQDGWHPGVIGIVAGRLKERFHRPAIAIALEGDTGKGSGRSVPGVDLGAAITEAAAAGVISGGGGHPMAAGLSLSRDQIPPLRAFLRDRLSGAVAAASRGRTLDLDGLVAPLGVKRGLCDALDSAGPFGAGNPEPRFAMADVRVVHLKILKERHAAVTLADGMGRKARGIAFGCVGTPLGDLLAAAADGAPVHLAGRIKPDDFRGGEAAQFHLEDGAFA